MMLTVVCGFLSLIDLLYISIAYRTTLSYAHGVIKLTLLTTTPGFVVYGAVNKAHDALPQSR